MIKIYCDACFKELESNRSANTVEYLKHIDDILDGSIGYVDNYNNAISGICKRKELCIGCYNRVMVAAVKHFRKIRKEASIK